MTTTTEKLARLQELCTQAKDSLYQRLVLAAEVLQDREWIDTNFRSEADAMDYLRDTYFPAETTIASSQLFQLICRFPQRSDWEFRKFNLQVMLDEIKPEKKPREIVGPTKAELRDQLSEARLEIAKLKAMVAELRLELAGRDAEINRLRHVTAEAGV